MCRNIKPLFNFDPPATDEEVHDASLQFVRKVSGYTKPSGNNEAAFEEAVDRVAVVVHDLMGSLTTTAKAKVRSAKRFSG